MIGEPEGKSASGALEVRDRVPVRLRPQGGVQVPEEPIQVTESMYESRL